MKYSQEEYDNARYFDNIIAYCTCCHVPFKVKKSRVYFNNTHNIKNIYCTPECLSKYKSEIRGTIMSECFTCKKPLRQRIHEQHRDRMFCSHSCASKITNLDRWTPLINKLNKGRKGRIRSKAELRIVELIRRDFPTLIVEENVRTLLPSKCEVDILIREKNLAIELNGPVHYFPIYGTDSLNKTKNRDIIKQLEIQQLGINLFVLDISMLNSTKKHQTILDKMYYDNIKPLLL